MPRARPVNPGPLSSFDGRVVQIRKKPLADTARADQGVLRLERLTFNEPISRDATARPVLGTAGRANARTSACLRYVSIDATMTCASMVMKSTPISATRTHASTTMPLSRTRSRTSTRFLPPDDASISKMLHTPTASSRRGAPVVMHVSEKTSRARRSRQLFRRTIGRPRVLYCRQQYFCHQLFAGGPGRFD